MGTGSLPLNIREVSEGAYNLYLLSSNGGQYAECTVESLPGKITRIQATLYTPNWLRGTIVGKSGKALVGLKLNMVEHPSWPNVVMQNWGECGTDSRGRFALCIGLAQGATFEIESEGGSPLGRHSLLSNDGNLELELDDSGS